MTREEVVSAEHSTDEVHFLVVNYFGAGALRRYVESLLIQDSPRWRLTVVDNSDCPNEWRALQAISALDPRIGICRSPANLGYFGAAHWWISTERRAPSTWTVVSNVDLDLHDETFVSRLSQLDGDAPVVAPLITALPSRRPQNPHLTARPSKTALRRLKLVNTHRAVSQLFLLGAHVTSRLNRAAKAQYEQRRCSIYAPHGSMILLHRRFFDAGGTLAHPVFMFGEEMNIAEQCRRLGLTVMFEPSLRARHYEHQATGILRNGRILQAQRDAADYCYRLIADAAQ